MRNSFTMFIECPMNIFSNPAIFLFSSTCLSQKSSSRFDGGIPAARECDLWPRKWRSLSLIATRSILSTLRTRCKGVRLARDSSYGNPRSNLHPHRSNFFGTRSAITRGLRSSTNIDAERRRGNPWVWRTAVFQGTRFRCRKSFGLSFLFRYWRTPFSRPPVDKIPRDDGMGGNRLTKVGRDSPSGRPMIEGCARMSRFAKSSISILFDSIVAKKINWSRSKWESIESYRNFRRPNFARFQF